MGPRKSQGTIQPGPTQFQLEMYMNNLHQFKKFCALARARGGGGLTPLSVPSHAKELDDIERVDA